MLSCVCNPVYRLAVASLSFCLVVFTFDRVSAADRLTGLHSAQVMSQSMPWIAQEAGLFKKYDLDFRLVFIGGVKNFLTHSIVGKPEIKRPEDLKGKKVAVGRFGGNTHYFTIQALRKFGMDASKDIQTIQTGGGPETLAALIAGNVDAAGLVAPGDA